MTKFKPYFHSLFISVVILFMLGCGSKGALYQTPEDTEAKTKTEQKPKSDLDTPKINKASNEVVVQENN